MIQPNASQKFKQLFELGILNKIGKGCLIHERFNLDSLIFQYEVLLKRDIKGWFGTLTIYCRRQMLDQLH